MNLPKDLKDDIWEYCRVNDITAIDDFTLKLIKQGFTIEKYGATPVTNTVEKIVEKIIEVPIEKIVERTIEVPTSMVDDEMSAALTAQINENELLRAEIISLKNELELEKGKNKKDIYGER